MIQLKSTYHRISVKHRLVILLSAFSLLAASSALNPDVSEVKRYVDFADVPETVPAISTSLKELIYTDATNGIQQIQAPEPNQYGTANLSFPLKLPQGRKGMTPALSIDYNSDSGTSWLGLGWNIGTPTIDVETRWGVPRYSPTDETETYILNGDQLAPVAHRGAPISRTPDKVFNLRIEGSFQRITRHGSSPKNYWWEVTNKEGTTSYYGGIESSNANAVLKDDLGNIAQWYLVRQIDKNDNTINYRYESVSHAGVPGGTVAGKNIYLSRVDYTGHGSDEGAFTVTFSRQQNAQRADIEIDCKFGLKKVTADLLDEIFIHFNGELVRSYRLNYIEGAFYKTLLSDISEYDSAGDLFYKHEFDYFDDIREGTTYNPYAAPQTWSVAYDEIIGPILNPIDGIDGETSMLGAAETSGFSAGSAVTVGPNDFILFSKINTAGGSYEYAQSNGNGLVALVDISGDGLPDKLYKRDGLVYYRPNLMQSGTRGFGESFEISGLLDFSTFKSRTHSVGAEAHPFGAFVGYTYSNTKNTIKSYFSDFNGDGLVDIAKNGSVYFNSINSSGHPEFNISSSNTPSPIVAAAGISDELIEIDPQEFEDMIDAFPLHDLVRFWEAPHAGVVDIDAPVHLVDNNSQAAQDYGKQDGVRVTIQHTGQELWSQSIAWSDFSDKIPTGVNNINVQPGDRIYFRLQSVFDGSYDQVIWDPEISYQNLDPEIEDANTKSISSYTASEDFVLASCQTVNMSVDGEIKILGAIEKNITSDDLLVEVIRTDTFNNTTQLISMVLPWDTSGVFPIEGSDLPVKFGDVVEFKVNSRTNIDWADLSWLPRMYYTKSYVDTIEVLSSNGDPLIDYCPAVSYSMYNGMVNRTEIWIADSTGMASVLPVSVPGASNPLGLLTYTIKGPRQLIYWSPHTIFGGLSLPRVDFEVEAGDTIYIELHGAILDMESPTASALSGTQVEIELGGNIDTITCGIHLVRPGEDIIFGPMYRYWGHFVYNGNRDRASFPIDESILVFDDDLGDQAEDVEDIGDVDDLENMDVNDGTSDPYVIMISDPKSGAWIGSDNLTFLKSDLASSSRLGEDDLLPDILSTEGGALPAPAIQVIVNAHSVSAGASAGPLSGAVGGSLATTRNIIDVVDFNGDLYPDIISENKVQYTLPTGGLMETITAHNLSNHIAKSEAVGVTIGGEFNASNASNSGGTSGSGSNNKTSRAKTSTNKSNSKSKNGTEGASSSVGIGGSYTADEDYAQESWLDMNGDGLVDKVYDDGRVQLNIGYRFLPAENWGFTNIWRGTSTDIGVGGGISLGNGSFQLGVSGSHTSNVVTSGLFDFNSDGLVDIISSVEPLMIKLNQGNGFGPEIAWTGVDFVDKGSADAQAANTAITVCIPITFLGIGIKICVNPSGSIMSGVSRQLNQIHDINGDGFADVLSSSSDGELIVSPSTIGKTNLLKSVTRPLGSSIDIMYARSGNTFGVPYSKWVMTAVDIFDGLPGDGEDYNSYNITYEEGMHHRHEREFLAYGVVRISELNASRQNYRTVVRTYDTKSFYHKGTLLSSRIEDADNQIFEEISYRYELRDIKTGIAFPPILFNNDAGSAFPALVEVRSFFSEGDLSNAISTYQTYEYDLLGNVTHYTDNGSGSPEDVLIKDIKYHKLDDLYVLSQKEEIITSDGNGQLLRHEVSFVDSRGNIERRQIKLNDQENAVFEYTIDIFGNIISEIRPLNHKGEAMESKLVYDTEVNTYLTHRTDGYGYTHFTKYDPVYGQVISSKDINGNPWEFEYDNKGRLVIERGPYEVKDDIPYLRKYTYFADAGVPYGTCAHYDPEYGSDITTFAFYDGLGRQVQTKTPVAIYTGKGSEDRLALRVSGGTIYDEFGRVKYQYYPIEENNGNSNAQLNLGLSPVEPEEYKFDILDRLNVAWQHDRDSTTFTYEIAATQLGQTARKKTETDPLGRIIVTYTDARDRTVSYELQSESLTSTQFVYNAASELISIFDQHGNAHEFAYDTGGRKIYESHPDMGVTEFEYDPAGNLIRKITAEIRDKIPVDGSIKYTYDKERLIQIDYPKNFQNQVIFHYGEPDSEYNRAGRIWLVEDASGGEELYFGLTEEVTKSIRTILLSETQMQTFIMAYDFDTWNRIKTITYADGETVSYNYNRGGGLKNINAIKGRFDYSIVEQMGYDLYGDLVYQASGNGVQKDIVFEPVTRTIARQTTTLPSGKTLIENDYSYNEMNLVTQIKGSSNVDPVGVTAAGNHAFTYDNFHRIRNASGTWSGEQMEEYSLEYQYDDLFNIRSYEIERTSNGQRVQDASYAGEYRYDDEQPHAPNDVRSIEHYYDLNGNLGLSAGSTVYKYVQLLWDEENRLQGVSNNGYITQFTYDAFGQRVIKSHGGFQGVFVDGAPAGFVQHTENYKIYVNGLMSATKEGFVKHYYTENNRVASKRGAGKFNFFFQGIESITAGDLDYSKRARLLRQAAVAYYTALGGPPGPPTLPWYNGQPEQTGQSIAAGLSQSYSITPPPGWPGPAGPPDPNGPPGSPVWFPQQVDRDSLEPGYNFKGNPPILEVKQFFFHRDIFGSTNYVTNYLGDVNYQIEYLPGGATFVQSVSDGELRPNMFSDRDYDEETELNYFQGFYYDATSGLFVNPGYGGLMAGLSPYTLYAKSIGLDSLFNIDRYASYTDVGIKHAAQAGINTSGNGVSADQNSFGGVGQEGVLFGSSSSPDDADNNDNEKTNPKQKQRRGKSNSISKVDDPKEVQYKRRARKNAKTGKSGIRRNITPETNKQERQKQLQLKRKRAKALARMKLEHRQFTFAPGDIGTQAGDRRAVRLGTKKKVKPARKFQHKPGRTRG